MKNRRKNKSGKRKVQSDTIPQEFLERVERIVGDNYRAQTLKSFAEPKDVAFRLNTLIEMSRSELVASLAELFDDLKTISWFGDGYFVGSESRERLVNCDSAQSSLIYIQNPSSYLPCLVLDPQPGESILDLCSAPGGKTLIMASLMKNEGLISAVEPVRGRFFKLQANLKRYGCQIAKTYLSDGRSVGRKVPERFDRVLIDAPCSGETRIHQTDPDSFEFWSERKVKEQSRKQYGLIRSGFDALRPGGLLVYCTCSFAPEENEKIVSDFLNDQPGAALESINIPEAVEFETGICEWNDKNMHADIGKTVRIIPGSLMNGFYIASIRKQIH